MEPPTRSDGTVTGNFLGETFPVEYVKKCRTTENKLAGPYPVHYADSDG